MNDFIKKNLALLLAFTLPVMLILIVTLSVYLPTLFLSTKYDFLYLSCAGEVSYSYGCGTSMREYYWVQDEKLNYRDDSPDVAEQEPYIFIHDTEKNVSRSISLEEAQTLRVNQMYTSPDGVTISEEYSRGPALFLLFDNSPSYSHYLTKGRARWPLNLVNESGHYYFRNDFRFLGWIEPGRN